MSGAASRAETEHPKKEQVCMSPSPHLLPGGLRTIPCWRLCSHDPLNDEEVCWRSMQVVFIGKHASWCWGKPYTDGCHTVEIAGKLPTGVMHWKVNLWGLGGSCPWRCALYFWLPHAAGICQVSTSEPGREFSFSCSDCQCSLLTNLNTVPDGKGEMFAGPSSISTGQVIKYGFGSER